MLMLVPRRWNSTSTFKVDGYGEVPIKTISNYYRHGDYHYAILLMLASVSQVASVLWIQ